MQNLVSNALRHSRGDRVTLTTGDNWIAVADNGAGLSDQALAAGLSGAGGNRGLPNIAALATGMAARIDFDTGLERGLSVRLTFAT